MAKKDTSNSMKVRFGFEQATKHTWRYKEVDENDVPIEDFRQCFVGTIYVRKSALATPTNFIEVTIETSGGDVTRF